MKIKIKHKPRKKCIICEKEIFRANNHQRIKTRRRNHDLTCSKKCSKIYNRVVHFIRPQLVVKIEKKLKEEYGIK